MRYTFDPEDKLVQSGFLSERQGRPQQCLGTIELADGSSVQGFLCEDYATKDAKDITAFGGWRAYIKTAN